VGTHDRIEHSEPGEDVVLRLERVVWICCFVQRSLDDQIADSVGRSRPAYLAIALDQEGLATGSRDECGRRQTSKAPADADDVIAIRCGLTLWSLAQRAG
jgi:hypothetical protein